MQPRLSFSLSRGAGSPRPRELSRRLGPRCPSRHAVSHQILQLIRIIDVENLMVELVDKHHVLTLPEAFFPTLLMANTRTLSAALRVANPAFFPFILGRWILPARVRPTTPRETTHNQPRIAFASEFS